MPIVGVAPRCLRHFEARLLRYLKCKQPGAKPFTYNEIKPNVYLGSLPHNADEVNVLIQQHQVAGFVTMNCSWELPGKEKTITVEQVRNQGVNVCHLPTPDYGAVMLSDMLKGADFVHQIAEVDNQGCYIHCNAGKGRSTMIVLAYLIKYQNMSAMDALIHIQEKRNIANFLCCCGIRPQWRGVVNFERRVRGGGNRIGRVAPEITAVSPARTTKQIDGTTLGAREVSNSTG